MRALLISLQFCFLTVVVTSTSHGDDSVDTISHYLSSGRTHHSVSNAGRNSVRVARAPKSVMSLSDEKLNQKAFRVSGNAKSVDPKALEAQRVRAEAEIDRQMKSLEGSLAREEQRLNARLAELGKKREAALRKEDEKLLKQIEQAEKQAIGEYEARVQRLLNSAMSASKQPYGASGKRAQQGGPTARTAPTAATKPKSPADEDNAPRRRRFKLWPFN